MTVRDINEYEDLLAEWSDLESGLGVLLANPGQTQQFFNRVVQYDRWMQNLMERDADVGLYLLFQLAGNSPVGYSASHALVCSVLCHLVAQHMALPGPERDSLVRGALTMNVAMTRLQDLLSTQNDKPTRQQQEQIQTHPEQGSLLLGKLGVEDALWLRIVVSHHDAPPNTNPTELDTPIQRLTHMVKLVDRYAALISPRLSRAGRNATESARMIMANTTAQTDPMAHAIVATVGLCPPGTFVHMDNDELGIVVKRSAQANLPYIAIVGDAQGELLSTPRLHNPAEGGAQIGSALPAASVRAQLKHAEVLQLGAHIAPVQALAI